MDWCSPRYKAPVGNPNQGRAEPSRKRGLLPFTHESTCRLTCSTSAETIGALCRTDEPGAVRILAFVEREQLRVQLRRIFMRSAIHQTHQAESRPPISRRPIRAIGEAPGSLATCR
jgi:hypothetical protein